MRSLSAQQKHRNLFRKLNVQNQEGWQASVIFFLMVDAFISELTWHKYSDDQQMNDGSSGVPSWRLFVRAHCQLRRVPVAQLVVFVLALKVWKNIHINPPD